MNFDGHDICKINSNWIFDLTTFTGYKIHTKNGIISKAEKAFKIRDDNQKIKFKFTYYLDRVPIGVLRKSTKVIENYYKEALLYE